MRNQIPLRPGLRLGYMVIVRKVFVRNTNTYWECLCDCGKTFYRSTSNINASTNPSCGCMSSKTKLQTITKHNLRYTRLYRIYYGMRARCYNPKTRAYKYYGERGITICDEWLSDFTKFYEWSINNGYSDELTIDRIDVNGNYEPANCRWVDMKTQIHNRRTSKSV